MSLAGKIMDFFADKAMTTPAFPRTKVKAISDDNNVGLDAILNDKSNVGHTHTAAEVGARPATWTPSASDVGAVPTSRTVNGKALSSNITLSASDVGARASTWMPTAVDVGALPQQCAYYASGAAVTVDTCNDPFALFASSLAGSTLPKLLGNPGFVYVFTLYYASTSYKLQIAFPYNVVSSAVAVRQSNGGTWKAWTRIDNHAPLTSDQYGTALPTAGTAGRIFFKKVT